MKRIWNRWCALNLALRILTGLIIGGTLGVIIPQATGISILGDIFVGALKAIAPVLVFVLVLSSLAKAGKGIGKQFSTVIILYLTSTLLAAFSAVATSFIFPVTVTLNGAAEGTAPTGIWEVLSNLLTNATANPVSALVNANYIGILTWSIILGLGLKKCASDSTKTVLSDISDAVSLVVSWVINLAPFGILGLVFQTVSTNGVDIFTNYGKLLLLLVGTMLLAALIINPLIVAICIRKNPYPLVLRCLRESGVTAFFTRSSAANIPINMELCKKLGLNEEVYSVSIPLGATINMNGAAITITIMSLTVAHTLGISVDFPTAFILSLLSAIGACGTSGVAGGSILLIPMACSLFGIGNDVAMEAVAVGFIIGVIQDSLETAINSSGDVIFAATAEFMQKRKDPIEI
ncbi:MAG: serine/threonine transporter SstT [Clostridium sp.]|nr:serine/threonine transporter SstT [Clostridium sp.]